MGDGDRTVGDVRPMVEGVSLLVAAAAGTGLGLAHGLEADHLAEITAQVLRRGGGSLRAFIVGAAFGLGHVLVALALGGLGLALGFALPAAWGRYIDGGTGLIIFGLGLTVVYQALRTPSQTGAAPSVRAAFKGQLLLGGLFAINPPPEAIAIVLLVVPSAHRGGSGWVNGLIMLVCFGVGIALSMGIYGLLVGRALATAGGAGQRLLTVLVGGAVTLLGALFSLRLGGWGLVPTLAGLLHWAHRL